MCCLIFCEELHITGTNSNPHHNNSPVAMNYSCLFLTILQPWKNVPRFDHFDLPTFCEARSCVANHKGEQKWNHLSIRCSIQVNSSWNNSSLHLECQVIRKILSHNTRFWFRKIGEFTLLMYGQIRNRCTYKKRKKNTWKGNQSYFEGSCGLAQGVHN